MVSTESTPSLDAAALYDALSNDRRRACVRLLADGEDWVAVKLLAEDVADCTAADTDDAVESTYISLIQIHLPKLASLEIIDYDEDEKLVSRGPAFEHAHDCLAAHAGARSTDETRLPTVIFGVSTVGLALALVVTSASLVLVGVVLAMQLAGVLATVDASLPGTVRRKMGAGAD